MSVVGGMLYVPVLVNVTVVRVVITSVVTLITDVLVMTVSVMSVAVAVDVHTTVVTLTAVVALTGERELGRFQVSDARPRLAGACNELKVILRVSDECLQGANDGRHERTAGLGAPRSRRYSSPLLPLLDQRHDHLSTTLPTVESRRNSDPGGLDHPAQLDF